MMPTASFYPQRSETVPRNYILFHPNMPSKKASSRAAGQSGKSGKSSATSGLPTALDFSRYARQLIAARPELAEELGDAAATAWTPAAMRAFLDAQSQQGRRMESALRDLRARVMLRTMQRDLAGVAPLAEVCHCMTDLAEVAIAAAIAEASPELDARMGIPVAPPGTPGAGSRQPFLVVGMGKLGGGELNVSSDIDLVFVYPEEGDTDTRALDGGRRDYSVHEYFSALGKRINALLSMPTAEGFVFRVDMRLRPWGDAGPLAISFDALEQYLVTQGREWERYAWIKGRALTGDAAAQHALTQLVRPFVFRKYLDYGAFAAMRELHAQIREEVARRELAAHVKLGPGGIREIEFIAQAFQLIRGGREQALQTRPTLEVLALLEARQLLDTEQAAILRDAYDFLRRVEHRIQYLDDAQTHELPQDAGDRSLLARAMGFADWPAFMTTLDAHRTAVSRQFEQTFTTRQERPRHALAQVWADDGEQADENAAHLKQLGFADPASAVARMAAIRGSARHRQLPDTSRERIDALMPRIIELAAARDNPDATLTRCLDLSEAISRRSPYLALLDEHPAALERVVGILSASPWAAEYLTHHPVLLDELIDSRLLLAAPDWPAFGRQLRATLIAHEGDAERQMDALRDAHHAQMFHLLAQDLAGALSVERLADHLSDLADLMLQITLEVCWAQLRNKHEPENTAGEPRFAIIGYGKLGGKELGYASDLDIIFIYDDDNDAAAENYARLAARLNNWLSSRTGAGVLFETDLRLRPDGASGLMVSSIDAFRRYQRESAWPWEHQALTRARYCAGDATTGAAFETERAAILAMPRDADKLRREVADMRQTMHEGHPNKSEFFDLKHDAGGMVDIEFIVQYLVLAHCAAHPKLARNDGNIALLGYAGELGLIDTTLAHAVGDAYREFRRLQHALRLEGAQYARVPPEAVAPHVEATRALWRQVFEAHDPH
jgi:glutamate-ammonia-ligase adenylyltransferase